MHRTLHNADGSVRKVRLGGWKRQSSDPRDEAFRVKLHSGLFAVPASVDLRPGCSPVEDQADLGSCTANGFAAIVEFNEIKRQKNTVQAQGGGAKVTVSDVTVSTDGNIAFVGHVVPPPAAPAPAPAKFVDASRLFGYYATRKVEGTISEDSGATIRDTIKAGALYGVADESTWPYDVSKFAVEPPKSVWEAAASHKVTSYHSIADGDVATMKSTLASGFLIEFGFQVYDYMMSAEMAKKGFLPVPAKGESMQGGHAVVLVGYDDSKQAFLVRNSWGTGWGIQGYFYMAYDYVKNPKLASDFWVIQSSPL